MKQWRWQLLDDNDDKSPYL